MRNKKNIKNSIGEAEVATFEVIERKTTAVGESESKRGFLTIMR